MASLCGWVGYLGDHGSTSAKTIKAYIKGLRSYHVDVGHSSVEMEIFASSMVKRIVDGIKRERGGEIFRERLPITKDVLLRILKTLDTNSSEGLNLHAAFCLAFAGFLRIGEFTYSATERDQHEFPRWNLTRGSVQFDNGGGSLSLKIPASKTDPFREGVTITIASTDDDGCPLASLQRLFITERRLKSAPLFDVNGSFNRDWVINRLRVSIQQVGLDGKYSGHSFRRGAATSARAAGLADDEIQLLGR